MRLHPVTAHPICPTHRCETYEVGDRFRLRALVIEAHNIDRLLRLPAAGCLLLVSCQAVHPARKLIDCA